jgi:urea transport system permease protein
MKAAIRRAGSDRGGTVLLSLVAAFAVLAPILNLAVPESSPFHLSSYVLMLIGKYMCYAILALAVDLVWGYAGILSLGHAAFFALGGYAMGMYLMRQIGTRGVYGHPVLPDFMVFLNWDTLPWFWQGFDRLWFAAIMIGLVPAALAYVFGWLAFRSRPERDDAGRARRAHGAGAGGHICCLPVHRGIACRPRAARDP